MTEEPSTQQRWSLIGPTFPYRGGIARHTTLLASAIRASGIDLEVTTFSRQYPGWLYKGASDRDSDADAAPDFTAAERLDSINPYTWFRAARAISDHSPDVVLLAWWHPYFAPMAGTLLRRLRRRSPDSLLVPLCHNVLPHETGPLDRFLARHALSPAHAVVTHSSDQADLVGELLGPRPVLTTPLPTFTVETPDADQRTEPTQSHEAITLLFFGLVRRYKGLDTLIRALPQVRSDKPVKLIVAGEFWEDIGRYRSLADQLGVSEHIEFRPGYVPESTVANLLAEADLMVAPYRSATQSAVVELAFGAGMPVVASDVGSLAEQVTDGYNGIVVAPEDPSELADAITTACQPKRLAQLRAGARADSTVHPWDALVKEINDFCGAVRGAGIDR